MSKKTISGQHNGFEFVEIGGIKWATCNVGADKPTDMGLYFQWGDRKGYTADEVVKTKRFDLNHYKHCNGKHLTKYNEFDNKQVLDLCDDAAFAYMGQGWRMPTREDFRRLVESTTHRWTNSYHRSGVAGMVLTDITDKSKELFFPAAGYCVDGRVQGVGSIGNYWSMSIMIGSIFGAYKMFSADHFFYSDYGNLRYCGFPIRGILTL